jgi:hypothetical protein
VEDFMSEEVEDTKTMPHQNGKNALDPVGFYSQYFRNAQNTEKNMECHGPQALWIGLPSDLQKAVLQFLAVIIQPLEFGSINGNHSSF